MLVSVKNNKFRDQIYLFIYSFIASTFFVNIDEGIYRKMKIQIIFFFMKIEIYLFIPLQGNETKQ
jgi:polyferredoxin